MYFRNSTQTPNKLFDIYLKALSKKELKVLLVVVRQTIGWIDVNGKRKKRDWMSQKFLANKTGLSPKSVSQGIEILVSKHLIIATSESGELLRYPNERKGKERIYYEISDTLVTFLPKPYVKSTQDPSTKGNNTKLTYTKQRVRKSKFTEPYSNNIRSLEDILREKRNDREEF